MAYDLYGTLYDALFDEGRVSKNGFLKTDIVEDPDCYILFVDLPGAKKEDINVDYSNKYLKITYKNELNEDENHKKKYVRRERFYGSLSRSFLFNDVDANNIEASYSDGVLKIILHKKVEENVKAIEIK